MAGLDNIRHTNIRPKRSQRSKPGTYVGIIAMATGGGKTKTALVATTRLQNAEDVRSSSSSSSRRRSLAHQWADEVRDFGLDRHVLSGLAPAKRRQHL